MDKKYSKVAILGGGNIGLAIANGLYSSKLYPLKNIFITRRKVELLSSYAKKGFNVGSNNIHVVKNSNVIIIAVTPQQLNGLLNEIKEALNPKNHVIISIVSGATIKEIKNLIGKDIPVVRAMPNTAIAIKESMTCISSDSGDGILELSKQIFDSVGMTLVISEELMVPATALCACGIAFFLRAVRAASQGGIEIGFHAEDALLMAAQTAKGAASLLTSGLSHPESEVDKVTTPMGCTISGLNQMEHYGFSSAMIRGIVTSADKAAKLYSPKN
jgi:pyrroline-5-carboxylate reductase